MNHPYAYKKFRSSGGWGGERFKNRPITPKTSPIDLARKAKEEIVQNLRDRAEIFEKKAEDCWLTNESFTYQKIAKELRACAASIRLEDWSGMDHS